MPGARSGSPTDRGGTYSGGVSVLAASLKLCGWHQLWLCVQQPGCGCVAVKISGSAKGGHRRASFGESGWRTTGRGAVFARTVRRTLIGRSVRLAGSGAGGGRRGQRGIYQPAGGSRAETLAVHGSGRGASGGGMRRIAQVGQVSRPPWKYRRHRGWGGAPFGEEQAPESGLPARGRQQLW